MRFDPKRVADPTSDEAKLRLPVAEVFASQATHGATGDLALDVGPAYCDYGLLFYLDMHTFLEQQGTEPSSPAPTCTYLPLVLALCATTCPGMLALNRHDVEVPLWEFLKNHGVVAVPPGKLAVHLPENQGPVVAPDEEPDPQESAASVMASIMQRQAPDCTLPDSKTLLQDRGQIILTRVDFNHELFSRGMAAFSDTLGTQLNASDLSTEMGVLWVKPPKHSALPRQAEHMTGNDLEMYTPLEEIFTRQGFGDGYFLGPLELDYMLKEQVENSPCIMEVYISEVNIHKHIQQVPTPSVVNTTVTNGGPLDITDLLRKLNLLALHVSPAVTSKVIRSRSMVGPHGGFRGPVDFDRSLRQVGVVMVNTAGRQVKLQPVFQYHNMISANPQRYLGREIMLMNPLGISKFVQAHSLRPVDQSGVTVDLTLVLQQLGVIGVFGIGGAEQEKVAHPARDQNPQDPENPHGGKPCSVT
eukprot:gene2043-3029_t